MYPKLNLRKGSAIVEMAAVSIIFFMFLFGILEYCRFLFVRQVIDNATREGARYAVVRTMDDDVEARTIETVRKRCEGIENSLSDLTISVYRSDENGAPSGPANATEFGDFITVQIDGDYEPIVPSLLFLNQKLRLSAKTLMNSEAN